MLPLKDKRMEKCQFQEMYPVYSREISKSGAGFPTLEGLCRYFCGQIEKHPFAQYIGTFDHYAHTVNIEGGEIEETIVGAKVVLFCFGKKLLDPRILSVRPRGIGVCETQTQYVVSFLEVPNASLTETMIKWVNVIDVR
ncbi:MAG: hypothetical protein JW902_03955 [Syntrophaceae bacterium]|nr:hypothetical protein [Syntrophaceae bacterium]